MFNGHNLIGLTPVRSGSMILRAFSPVMNEELPGDFVCATNDEMQAVVKKATEAFIIYSKMEPSKRADFLEAIGQEILSLGDALIQRAMLESGLPEARLVGERGRTVGQLKLFADILREGSWVEAVIDTAMPDRKPLPRSDIRKMLVPLGPVLVFGASNFPFAFSTAGGDTASALAAGNPVIVKAHEGHLGTNELMAEAIRRAAISSGMPDGVFSFVISNDIASIQSLVKDEGVKAIGFTGSYKAGTAIYKTATTSRKTPIPVYAEMSSINPVLMLPNKLQKDGDAIATQLAGSITLGTGQFCTNPGLLFLLADEASECFVKALNDNLSKAAPTVMLNKSVCNNYYSSSKQLREQPGITVLGEVKSEAAQYKGSASLFKIDAADFISNENVQAEVFGPSSLIVWCKDKDQMLHALQSLHGQLTGTIIGDTDDINSFNDCVECLSTKVGRLLYNGVPTGVEVCHAMVHGGPFPATTDARSTSVGADAIKRFVRPLCLQDCPSDMLPPALRDDNPLDIMRKLNGVYTKTKNSEGK
jgi:NADP-dependent aldehyde dehydrogenase